MGPFWAILSGGFSPPGHGSYKAASGDNSSAAGVLLLKPNDDLHRLGCI
jgi:hypothetical protein